MQGTLGMNEFISLFGDVSLATVISFVLALVFAYNIYKKVKDFFNEQSRKELEKSNKEKEKEKKINQLLDEVAKYPQYREESIKIRKGLQEEIDSLKTANEKITHTLDDMQESLKKRERNKLRARLLESYRYYTSLETNPKQEWNSMEAETFWNLFADYEEAGGNGYMHTVVQPEMNKLKVVEI